LMIVSDLFTVKLNGVKHVSKSALVFSSIYRVQSFVSSTGGTVIPFRRCQVSRMFASKAM
jgi:hypothetical protein